MTSGATGAPGERDWTTKIVPMVATKLRDSGVEVYECDAFAQNDSKVVTTDWDLFLSVHYDADIYNDRGGFTDFPDPSVDSVTKKSQKLSKDIGDHFFSTTGIPFKSRSNANTKFYYMWQYLTAKTPCVLIECGVGWRKPEDYNTLRKYEEVAKALSDAILKSLGVQLNTCEDKLEYERGEKEKYKKEARELREEVKELETNLKKCSDAKNEFATNWQIVQATLVEKEGEFERKEKEFSDELLEKEALITELEFNISTLSKKIKEQAEKIEKLKKKNLCSYSKKELIKALLNCK